MSFLDLYTKDQATDARIQPNEAHDLPATFSQGFDAAWSEGRLFGQSISGENARIDAVQDHINDVEQKTGKRIADKIDWSGFAFGGAPTADMLRELANVEAEKVGAPTISADDLEQRAVAKSRAAQTDYAEISAREKTFGGKVGMFVGGAASSGADPINLLALAVAPETEGVGILAAALRWGLVGTGAQTGIEVAGSPYREEVQPGYGTSGAPVYNIAEAFAGGAVLGGVTKALGNAWTRVKTGQWPTAVRDAGNVIESEANVANTNVYPGTEGEVAHRTALQEAIDAVVSGKPVNVDQHFTPSILAAYEQRLAPVMEARAAATAAQESAFALEREGARLPPTMEALSEQHLGEFRTAADRAREQSITATADLSARQQAIAEAGAAHTQRVQVLETQRADIASIQSEIEAAQKRAAAVPQHIDETTQARLEAIEADLAKKNLSDTDRARLQSERQSITETIAAGPSEAELSRQRGSHLQEAAGLIKTLATKQKALEKAEAKHARETAAVEKQVAAAAQQVQNIPARTAAQIEASTTGLRKTINKLAHDGYAVKLSREEAEAMAQRVISSPDRETADAALHDITEALVSRRQEAQRGIPKELPFGEPNPVDQKTAEATYHTDEMRKRIQALSREVGYDMPREDAAALAAKIATMPEQDALAALDKMMLSPRETAELLPTTPMGETYTGITRDGAHLLEDFTDRSVVVDMKPETIKSILVSPEYEKAVRADIDRERVTGDRKIPVGKDEQGEPIYRSLDAAMDEVDALKKAADHIQACANPEPDEKAA